MRRVRNFFLYGLLFLLSGFLLVAVVQISSRQSSSAYSPAFPICAPVSRERTSTAQPEQCSEVNTIYGNYCVITPYKPEERNDAPVTLCTQGTVEFLHHVVVLCHRWSGPISVAVYSPVEDYIDARRVVTTLRHCDYCVRYWVTWHFFFQAQEMPIYQDEEFSKNCSSVTQGDKRKRRSEGTYPINVGRNVARVNTKTPYVFSIDIELYPSPGILPKFERMLHSMVPSNRSQVWVLPIFEVYSKYRVPIFKDHLKTMFNKRQVISFHKYRCNSCHKIPNLTEWMDTENTSTELEESLEPLKVWRTVKRNKQFNLQFWEPFFIGTKRDPEFDIRLSWEGKQNKMQVAYEMCLQNYDFHIVENAFLVHTPGINVYSASKDKKRLKYVAENDKIISEIRKTLQKKYRRKYQC